MFHLPLQNWGEPGLSPGNELQSTALPAGAEISKPCEGARSGLYCLYLSLSKAEGPLRSSQGILLACGYFGLSP